VVTTGQQPQLFGGPLYVLYKALTAVRTARDVERRSGRPCLAVFWVAADDHDWAEVASVSFLDRDERLRRITLEAPPGRSGRAVGPSLLPPSIGAEVAAFLDALEADRSGSDWDGALREAYVEGRSFTEAFVAVASSWLPDLPVAFLDAAHPEVRRASTPLFRQVLERSTDVEEALARGTREVETRGYAPQLAHIESAIPLFRDGEEGRFRLRASRGRAIQFDGRGDARSEDEILSEIEAEPDRYSPSAALRPVVESFLLPVEETVLGPGEIAYWAQLAPLFDCLDTRMPGIRPRDSWRVVDGRVKRLLERIGITADDARDPTAAAARLVAAHRPAGVVARLADLGASLSREYEALAETVGEELPGLRSAVGKSRKRALDAVQELGDTVDRAVRDGERTRFAQLDRATAHLYPEGEPQERRLATWQYLMRHGRNFLDAARAASGIDPTGGGWPSRDAVAGASPQE
jgi:bacillithiol biosynthesis cysteine-adding enzyme BshC